MKIFVTGSSGFIGFHLSKKLFEKGHNVHGFDSMNNYYDVKIKKARLKILSEYKKFSFTKSKLENKKIISKSILKFKPKVIVHLAAQAGVRYSIENPRVYLDSNITGTYNIIELAKKVNVKHLLIASSSSVYGANKKLPFKEIDKTETQLSIYAATKKSTESIAHSYSHIWKIPVTILEITPSMKKSVQEEGQSLFEILGIGGAGAVGAKAVSDSQRNNTISNLTQ